MQTTFDEAPRYLTNSQFSANVHSGWIGTRRVPSQATKNMTQNLYETGRALVVAYEIKLAR